MESAAYLLVEDMGDTGDMEYMEYMEYMEEIEKYKSRSMDSKEVAELVDELLLLLEGWLLDGLGFFCRFDQFD